MSDSSNLEDIIQEMTSQEYIFLNSLSKSQQHEYCSILKKRIESSHTDPLTKVGNLRSKEHNIKKQECMIQRAELLEYSHLILDLDYFKDINDYYGHCVGDKVLYTVASHLVNNTREEDLVFREGGEEFSLILPHISLQGALNTANRIREDLKNISIENLVSNYTTFNKQCYNYKPYFVTASIGVCNRNNVETIEELYCKSDDCLYLAKKNGRDSIAYFENELKLHN